MEYRIIGRTGQKVSELGFGCEGMIGKTAAEVKEYIDELEKSGANIIDLYSPNPEMRTNLGIALKGRREKFILQAHMCTIWQDDQYMATRNLAEVKTSFEDQLERLQTDYIDIGMIHYIDSFSTWQDVKQNGILAYALELKAKGIVKALGISSHNPKIAQVIAESGDIDVIMFSINPCYDLLPGTDNCEDLWNPDNYKAAHLNMDPERQKLYETCQRMGIGITVMKPFGGGDLLHEEWSPAKKALTVNQCLQYALDRPGVVAIMCGARNINELRGNMAYCEASDAEKDYASALASFPKISWSGHCMYCGHCAPCPMGISVADITKFLNLCLAQGDVPETVREHYASLEHHASECVQCGSCNSRCPFQVNAVENMQKAVEIFGF